MVPISIPSAVTSSVTAPTPTTTTTTTPNTTTTIRASNSSVTTSSSSDTVAGSLEEAHQRYLETKLAVRNGLAKKRIIDRSLTDLESQIYLFEGSYLSSTTTSGGNIVKGFDSYLKNTTSSSKSNLTASEVAIEDRIFSLSSATFQKSLELKAAETLNPTTTTTTTTSSVVVEEEREKKSKEKEREKRKERSATPSVSKEKEKDSTEKNLGIGFHHHLNPVSGTSTPKHGQKTISSTGASSTTKLKRKVDSSGISTTNTTPAGGKNSYKRKKEDD